MVDQPYTVCRPVTTVRQEVKECGYYERQYTEVPGPIVEKKVRVPVDDGGCGSCGLFSCFHRRKVTATVAVQCPPRIVSQRVFVSRPVVRDVTETRYVRETMVRQVPVTQLPLRRRGTRGIDSGHDLFLRVRGARRALPGSHVPLRARGTRRVDPRYHVLIRSRRTCRAVRGPDVRNGRRAERSSRSPSPRAHTPPKSVWNPTKCAHASMWPKNASKPFPVTTCEYVAEQRVERVPVTTCRMVAETASRQVAVSVPEEVPVTINRCVARVVPRQIAVQQYHLCSGGRADVPDLRLTERSRSVDSKRSSSQWRRSPNVGTPPLAFGPTTATSPCAPLVREGEIEHDRQGLLRTVDRSQMHGTRTEIRSAQSRVSDPRGWEAANGVGCRNCAKSSGAHVGGGASCSGRCDHRNLFCD